MIFMTSNDFSEVLSFGPKAHGAHGTLHFSSFFEKKIMVWDLSTSVPMMFRTPGNPLINLFDFVFNSKCHFSKVRVFIQLPIVLPIELPIGLRIVLPIELPIAL